MKRIKTAHGVIFVLLALALAAALWLLHVRKITYVPTGDEMFDHYALALIHEYRAARKPFSGAEREKNKDSLFRRLAYPSADLEYYSLIHGLMSTQLFEDIKAYENTSEYWELRFMVGRDESDLEEAIRRGLATTSMLDLFDFNQMVASEPERALSISNLGIELDPANSCYYYQKANQLLLMGDSTASLEWLKAGNMAPRNEWPKPYSLKVVENHLLHAKDIDSQVVAFSTWIKTPIPLLLFYRSNAERVVDAIKAGEDPVLLNEWLEFTRRFALMDGQSLVAILVAAGAQRFALELVLDSDLLTEHDREVIGEALVQHKELGHFISSEFLVNYNEVDFLMIGQKFNRCLYEHYTIEEVQARCEFMGLQLELSEEVRCTP